MACPEFLKYAIDHQTADRLCPKSGQIVNRLPELLLIDGSGKATVMIRNSPSRFIRKFGRHRMGQDAEGSLTGEILAAGSATNELPDALHADQIDFSETRCSSLAASSLRSLYRSVR
jgi:hypothetical protein